MTPKQNIVILDSDTLGIEFDLKSEFEHLGNVTIYSETKNDEILERIENSDIVLTNKVVLNRDILSRNNSVKLISVLATGLNNVDLEFAQSKGIIVKNVSDYSTNSVTQHTFTLLLSLVGTPNYYDQYIKASNYANQNLFTHIGTGFSELNKKTIGIIGLGNIGRNVAKVATAFGMNVQYYSTSGKNSTNDFKQCNLDEILTSSDIISIHAPLNANTKNLISAPEFRLMKKTSILLNTGRGGIINEIDLAEALNNNIISKAGIDVFENEPININNPLLSINDPNKIILSPHIAWASLESRQLLIQKTVNNIESFLNSYD